MLAALTSDDCLELLRGRVDRGWLEETLADPDGRAQVLALCDIFAAVDAKDAELASSLFLAPHSLQVALPATGAEKATTTLAVTLRKQVKSAVPVVLPAGTRVATPDGHVYLTDAPLSWGQGEVGAAKTVGGTAMLAGHPGAIPPGEITTFVDVAHELSGVGTSIGVVMTSGSTQALRLTTDVTVPHPFRDLVVGMLLEVTSSSPGGATNVGRVVALDKVTGTAVYADPMALEGAYGWGASVAMSDPRYSVWATGPLSFEWRVVPWSEIFSVTNTVAVVGGRDAMLDELAQSRGRPRQPGEEDEPLRARLTAAPEPPSPLGVLRKSLRALVPFAFGRLDIRVYELGEPGPETEDPYALNFPSACGFIADLHCTDMSTPETPDGMASVDPSYAPLSPAYNPGLALCAGYQPWAVVVRWDPPAGMAADLIAAIRRFLFFAAKRAAQPGCVVQLYYPEQWSYP